MPISTTNIPCAPASRSIRPSPATASSIPIRYRFRRSPSTRKPRRTWWIKSDSTTDLMIAAKSAGRPSRHWWPAFAHLRWQSLALGGLAVVAALLAIAPIASLILLAFGDTGDFWFPSGAYVIPPALAQTALLLAGGAAVTIVVGAGTAWIVATFT